MKLLAALLVVVLGAPVQPAPELVASKVAKLPVIDGKADDDAWKSAKELKVPIDEPLEEKPKKSVTMKAVHDGDSICILMVWEDADKNDQHCPFVWKGTAYEEDGEKAEDFCSIGFALTGKFDSDMKAGVVSTWDVWEWGAARTNASGYALDRTHIFSKTKPADPIKSKKMTDRNQEPIFFAHPVDEGTPCYKKIDAPEKKGAEVIPQYVTQTPTGSAADVQAKGEWAGGKWTVEFKRKLNTGHKDDTVFAAGKGVEFAIATFDKCEKGDHLVSRTVVLKIQ
jgi:hypothetical protein